jgi:uncharacterized membrane protein
VSRRTLLILLFVSLALNLFVLGAVAGATFLPQLFHPHRPPAPFMAAGRALSPAQAEAYREALSSQAMAVRGDLREARRLRRDAWLRLGAEPMDAAAITAELDKARGLEGDARAAVDRRILDFASRLPAADRAKLGQALAVPPHHGMWRSAPPPGGPPPQP